LGATAKLVDATRIAVARMGHHMLFLISVLLACGC
jgi:hypothetical protein